MNKQEILDDIKKTNDKLMEYAELIGNEKIRMLIQYDITKTSTVLLNSLNIEEFDE